MDNAPIFFEGPAVITNVIATGASFAITNYGDVYIPSKITRVYNLKRGQHITITARKNFKDYESHAPYLIVEVKDAYPSQDVAVTAHVSDTPEEVETLTPFADLTPEERWEAVLTLCEDAPYFSTQDLINHYYDDEEDRSDGEIYTSIACVLDELLEAKKLYAMYVYTGSDEDEDQFALYYGIDPNRMCKPTY